MCNVYLVSIYHFLTNVNYNAIKEMENMEKIEFLTQDEKNALSFNDLATYMELLNMLKAQIESVEQ